MARLETIKNPEKALETLFLYLAVSTQQQLENGNLEDQKDELVEFAEREYPDSKIIAVYEDVRSRLHSDPDQRAGWNALMSEISEGDIVLVTEQSRITASKRYHVIVENACLMNGFKILDCSEDRFCWGVDDLPSEVMSVIKRHADHTEVVNKIARAKRGYKSKLKSGGRATSNYAGWEWDYDQEFFTPITPCDVPGNAISYWILANRWEEGSSINQAMEYLDNPKANFWVPSRSSVGKLWQRLNSGEWIISREQMCVGPEEIVNAFIEITKLEQESEDYRPMTEQEYCEFQKYLEEEE
jgi:DNA invertase Pin-like site-specific DNA recombinase